MSSPRIPYRVLALGLCVVISACSDGGGKSAAPTLSLVANPSAVTTGEPTTLTWNATNADQCVASGSWSGTGPTSGSLSATPTKAGSYPFDLTCTGAGGSVTKSTTVTVTDPPVSPTVNLSAGAATVPVGQPVTLSWSASPAQSCTAADGWSGTKPVQGSESVVVASAGDNRYTLKCTNGSLSSSQSVVVTGAVPTVTLSATPATLGPGQTTTLAWSTTNAQACTAGGEWSGAKATAGQQDVTISSLGAHTFTLTCTSASQGGATGTASTTATGAAATLNFAVFPATATVGQPATLSWTSSNSQSCTASGGWSGTQALSGTRTFTVGQAGTTSYTLTCANAAGQATKTTTLTGTAAPALPPATAYQITPDHAGGVTFANGLQFPTAPAWSVDLGGTPSYALIAGGLVYVTVGNNGSNSNARLYALDQGTGKTVWGPVSLSGTYPFANATYENNRVFVMDYDGLLRAFDAKTGAVGWSVTLPGQYGFIAPPTAFGGTVFVGGPNPGGSGTGGALYAIDEGTGKIVWTQKTSSGSGSSPAVTSSGVYVTNFCQFYDFSPVFGSLIWQRTGGCSGIGSGSTPAVGNDVLYGRSFYDVFSDSGKTLTFFDANSGSQLGAGASDTIPAVTRQRLFVMRNGTLQGLDVASGDTLWSFTGDGDDQLVSAPIVVNDRVLVGSASGKVYAVDAASGTLVWTGTGPAGLERPDEQNGSAPRSGLAAGEGLLVAPARTTLTAWVIAH